MIIRRSIRALILNNTNQLLLMELSIPNRTPFWCTIGGRVEDDEKPHETLRREIVEETGMQDFAIKKPVAWGEHIMEQSGSLTHFKETFYYVVGEQMSPQNSQPTEEEQAVVRQIAWWSLEDITSTQATIYPKGLARLLEQDWDAINEPIKILM